MFGLDGLRVMRMLIKSLGGSASRAVRRLYSGIFDEALIVIGAVTAVLLTISAAASLSLSICGGFKESAVFARARFRKAMIGEEKNFFGVYDGVRRGLLLCRPSDNVDCLRRCLDETPQREIAIATRDLVIFPWA